MKYFLLATHSWIWWECHYRYAEESSVCQRRWGNHVYLMVQTTTNSIAEIMQAERVTCFGMSGDHSICSRTIQYKSIFLFLVSQENMDACQGPITPNPASAACEQHALFPSNPLLKCNKNLNFYRFKLAVISMQNLLKEITNIPGDHSVQGTATRALSHDFYCG